MAKRMDKITVGAIKNLLSQYDVKEDDRIVIDLKNSILSKYEDADISYIMSLRGTIAPERAEEWLRENEKMR